MTKRNTRRGFTQTVKDVIICPPCGEQSLAPEGFNPGVAGATKEGQNRKITLWPLLPRLTAVLPPQGRERPHGFTLIELLVVVLIIGILAAVALPQYNKAVEKTKLTEVLVNLNALEKATDLYILENGIPSSKYEMFPNAQLNWETPSSSKGWTFIQGYESNEGDPYLYVQAIKPGIVTIQHRRSLSNTNSHWDTKECQNYAGPKDVYCNILEKSFGYTVVEM